MIDVWFLVGATVFGLALIAIKAARAIHRGRELRR